MTKEPYDDDVALAEYVSRYLTHFLSELEKQHLRLCGEIYRIEGFQENECEEMREWANQAAHVFWNRQFDPELKSALEMGFVGVESSSSNCVGHLQGPTAKRLLFGYGNLRPFGP